MAAPFGRDVLPSNIKPINYDLSIYDLELGGSFTYQGTVSILAKILRSTNEIVLNSHQLIIRSAEVTVELAKSQQTFKTSGTRFDAPRRRVTISFQYALPITEKAVITLKFEGTMNHDMAGFSRARYKSTITPAASVPMEGDEHLMFSTQFEACDARRAFPCFDEPNLKATFDFEIEIPSDLIALSNMPEKGTRKTKNGFHAVSFERTPVMSTYLLAWAVGDFEYVEDFTQRKYNGKALPVRVYTTRGLKNQAQYALSNAPQVIDYFSEVFGIDYPLPKADLLAVHEFSTGAMENWGLVTYRTTSVLFDEKTSDVGYKSLVSYVIAHELAHQWFGNLVTMDWWDELWLNEGFATWVGWLATDHFHPEWDVWSQFVSQDMQTAFTRDSLRSSHPIEVPIKNALDVDQIFDDISYRKGSSVIRMLAAHLGQQKFLKGVSNYLKERAYSNATTQDLWSALSQSSGQDVNSLMEPWIRKIGFPVVTVDEEINQIRVKQSRYLSTGDVTADEDTTNWWIPLGVRGKIGNKEVAPISLTAREDVITGIESSFYKLNVENAGFYRIKYPPRRLAKLGTQMDQLSVSDKIGLIGDAGALAASGESSTPGLLALIEGCSSESKYLVWSQILGSLGTVKSVFSDDTAITDGLKSFILKLIGSAVQKVGWKVLPDEDLLTSKLRSLLILSAGLNGHKEIIAEAQRRFKEYIGGKDRSAVHPSLRAAIFGISIRYGSSADYLALKKEWQTTESIDGREICLRALARLQTPQLLDDYLSFLFNDVAMQDLHIGAIGLAANPKTRQGLWMHIQRNFDTIRARLGENMVVMELFIRHSLKSFTDRRTEQEITKFFKGRDNSGYDRALEIVKDTILGRAAYKERDAAAILAWLKANGYA